MTPKYSTKDSASSNRKFSSQKALNTDQKKLRLNHFISKYGSSFSRRQADQLILNKKVTVNGKLTTQLSSSVHPLKDKIHVQKKEIRPFFKPVYIAFHKPEKVLTTAHDPQNRITVYHYLKKLKCRVFPVGRLDWNTQGLLLLTNDGDWAKKIIQPSSNIHKTYLVQLSSSLTSRQMDKLKKGVSLAGRGRVRAVSIKRIKNNWVQMVIREGKNRQIHLMFQKLGFTVKKLKRTAIGRLKLKSLPKGRAVHLTGREIQKIFQNPSPYNKKTVPH